jgi:hypothetical protein
MKVPGFNKQTYGVNQEKSASGYLKGQIWNRPLASSKEDETFLLKLAPRSNFSSFSIPSFFGSNTSRSQIQVRFTGGINGSSGTPDNFVRPDDIDVSLLDYAELSYPIAIDTIDNPTGKIQVYAQLKMSKARDFCTANNYKYLICGVAYNLGVSIATPADSVGAISAQFASYSPPDDNPIIRAYSATEHAQIYVNEQISRRIGYVNYEPIYKGAIAVPSGTVYAYGYGVYVQIDPFDTAATKFLIPNFAASPPYSIVEQYPQIIQT